MLLWLRRLCAIAHNVMLRVAHGWPGKWKSFTCNSRLLLQELESIPGAKEELERRAAELDWSKR